MNRKFGFIFPGQGSQYVGMGKELLEEFPETRNYFKKGKDILDLDLRKICVEGPKEILNNTRNTQPAIYTLSMIIYNILVRKGIKPSIVAGHSLGEYSALAAANAFSFEDGLRLVRQRGILMDEALPEGQGSMAAIIGLNKKDVLSLCSEVNGVCEIANYNSPGQIVISGEKQAIIESLDLARDYGAKRAIELDVSGPFHSSLMKPVHNKFKEILNNIEINNPDIPVIANVTADFVKTSSEINKTLTDQLTNSVCWVESMGLMVDEGVELLIEVGPGRVLKGLMRRINRSIKVYNVQDVKSLNKFLQNVLK